MKLLIANRGEIAIRIMRAAAELNMPTVAVFPEDDANTLHTRKADEAITLKGVGSAAYLDIEQIIAAAKETNCDAIHPAESRNIITRALKSVPPAPARTGKKRPHVDTW